MRKRALSILLCAALALSLAACGGGQTGSNSTEPPAESTSSDQQTTKPESTQPEETEPAETKPTETESEETQPAETESEETTPAETEPEETQPTETAPEASAFLALLQAEYQSDTALGLTGQHAFFQDQPYYTFPVFSKGQHEAYMLFGFGDTLYVFCANDRTWFAYDLSTKTQTPLTGPDIHIDFRFFLDGAVYYMDGYALIRDDLHGNTVNLSNPAGIRDFRDVFMRYYGGGFLCYDYNNDTYLYTGDMQKIASISAPQQEAAHGLTETVQLDPMTICAAGGKIYAMGNNSHLYSLDPTAATPEWTDIGEFSAQPEMFQEFVQFGGDTFFQNFLGRYYYSDDDRCFYDITTGETVFELGELYAPVGIKSYFGGDSYIGYKDKEYRMVNLANGTMSDPLMLPEKYNGLYFLTDTYCAYSDDYGIFLWNYLTGEETTIVMYEQN